MTRASLPLCASTMLLFLGIMSNGWPIIVFVALSFALMATSVFLFWLTERELQQPPQHTRGHGKQWTTLLEQRARRKSSTFMFKRVL